MRYHAKAYRWPDSMNYSVSQFDFKKVGLAWFQWLTPILLTGTFYHLIFFVYFFQSWSFQEDYLQNKCTILKNYHSPFLCKNNHAKRFIFCRVMTKRVYMGLLVKYRNFRWFLEYTCKCKISRGYVLITISWFIDIIIIWQNC